MTKRESAADRAAWLRLVALEPRLLGLEREALAYRREARASGKACANAAWYGYGSWDGRGLKPRLVRMVGWTAGDPSREEVHRRMTGRFATMTTEELLRKYADTEQRTGTPIAPELVTSEAYDVAYDHIYRLLPDCRGCACVGGDAWEAGDGGQK